jgi:hypothetical protein
MKKEILMLSYMYPPTWSIATQRSAKFAKYLKESWYIVHVITVYNKCILQKKDKSLLKDIKWIKVYKLIDIEIVLRYINWFFLYFKLKKISTLFSSLFVPDFSVLWWFLAFIKAKKIIKKHNIYTVFTTSSPYTSHIVWLKLKNHFWKKIQWICDFRDEWTNNPFILDDVSNKKSKKFKKEFILESKVLEKSDKIIWITDIMNNNFINIHSEINLKKNKFFVISNWYDNKLNINWYNKKNEKLTFSHIWSFYWRQNPLLLLNAINNLVNKQLIDENKISIKLYWNSNYSSEMKQLLNPNIYDLKWYIPNEEVIEIQKQSDILILIIWIWKNSESIYTWKIFEYITMNRLILWIIDPKWVAAQLIKETETWVIIDHNSLTDTEQTILRLYKKWNEDNININPNWEEVKKYSRKNLTQKLINIIEK